MTKTTTNNYLSNYELIEQLNNTIKSKHSIISKACDTYYNKYQFKVKEEYQKHKLFDSFGDYVNYISPILAKSIIKSMYSTLYKKVDKELSTNEHIVYKYIHGVNYESTKKIIDSGYTDSMYFDIVGEISLYLCEHENNIDIVVLGTWESIKFIYSFSNEMFLDIYKVVRKYLYNNSQKQINKEYSIMCLDTDGENYIIDTLVNSKDYKNYQYNEINEHYLYMVEVVINNIVCYVQSKKSKKLKVDILKTVLYGLASGKTARETNIAHNTYFKYKKAIIDCFEKSDFNKFYNQIVIDNMVIDYSDNTPHNTMCIDLTNSNYPNIFNSDNNYEYMKYTDVFENLQYILGGKRLIALKKSNDIKMKYNDRVYRNELWLDRR